eukprot:4017502-Prymnesium_polylepis.2
MAGHPDLLRWSIHWSPPDRAPIHWKPASRPLRPPHRKPPLTRRTLLGSVITSTLRLIDVVARVPFAWYGDGRAHARHLSPAKLLPPKPMSE